MQIGTAFIASTESAANKFITEIEKSGAAIPAYPIQAALVSSIRMEAQQQNNKEFTALWAGQSASKSEKKPAAEIFSKMIKEAEELI